MNLFEVQQLIDNLEQLFYNEKDLNKRNILNQTIDFLVLLKQENSFQPIKTEPFEITDIKDDTDI